MTTTVRKRHIRDQASKHLTLARVMTPVWSKLTLSQSRVPTNDQRTGIRHPEILALIKMPRQAEITAARNSRHRSISTRPSRRVFIAIEHATNVAGMDREKVI